MRLTKNRRRVLALVFAGGIGTIGSQESDATDAANDFTHRRERRPLVQRPVEPDEHDEQDHEVCVIDIETTGFMPGRDAIVEIGVIRVETRDGVCRHSVFNELVRPAGNIPKVIRDMTGITNEAVQDADRIDKVLPRAVEFIGDAPLVAHNAHFDRRFLEHNARLMGRTLAGNEWICTQRMAERAGLERPHKLSSLAERLGVGKSATHRTLDDCRATLGVWLSLNERLRGNVSLRPLPTNGDVQPREVAYDADLHDEVFVFSGFRDEVLAARIANAGGRVSGGISRKVTTLLVADENTATGKVTKAIEYGIRIRTKQDFEDEFYIAP